MPYDKEKVAHRLRAIRKDKQLDQAELAEKSGVSKYSIAKVELAEGGMNLDTAFDLTNALGCTLEQLVCRQNYTLQTS